MAARSRTASASLICNGSITSIIASLLARINVAVPETLADVALQWSCCIRWMPGAASVILKYNWRMTAMYTTNLRKVGGSIMLAVPPALLQLLRLRPGGKVGIAVESGRLIVEPQPR